MAGPEAVGGRGYDFSDDPFLADFMAKQELFHRQMQAAGYSADNPMYPPDPDLPHNKPKPPNPEAPYM
jgi:hypothetical protein